jgi:hypothetical protein
MFAAGPTTEMRTEHSRLGEPDTNAHEDIPPAGLRIGGFLIIVGIGLVISFVKNLEQLAWSIIPFRGEVWEKLTTTGSSAYHPYWKEALLFGIISASVILALSAIGFVLFFRNIDSSRHSLLWRFL